MVALREFYQNHFGFTLVEEIGETWVVLQAGNTEIAFHEMGKQYWNSDHLEGQRNAKIVFEVVDTIISKRAELLNAGVKMKGIKTFGGFPYLYCDGEDFEGNVFQLMQKVNVDKKN